MLFCDKCGKRLEKGTKKCPFCEADVLDAKALKELKKAKIEEQRKNAVVLDGQISILWFFLGFIGSFITLIFLCLTQSSNTIDRRIKLRGWQNGFLFLVVVLILVMLLVIMLKVVSTGNGRYY